MRGRRKRSRGGKEVRFESQVQGEAASSSSGVKADSIGLTDSKKVPGADSQLSQVKEKEEEHQTPTSPVNEVEADYSAPSAPGQSSSSSPSPVNPVRLPPPPPSRSPHSEVRLTSARVVQGVSTRPVKVPESFFRHVFLQIDAFEEPLRYPPVNREN